MTLIKLKEINQGTWLNTGKGPSVTKYGGLCYFMCNYHESNQGIWNEPKAFNQAVLDAKNFGKGTAMMNYAKAQNLKVPQNLSSYIPTTSALTDNSIYRILLSIGATGSPNHAVIAVTGVSGEVVFFEPNFGFYESTTTGVSNRQAFEDGIAKLYGKTSLGSFEYYNVRSINQSSPLGF
ncbi:hypothetical protein [Flammeovirga pacifica]|uniref:Peptidase C58 YopT-type domain-containing protein n=1 Tax=Flammeovirga pacifica TaxID=915059 RepID=A0A1S1YT38_FLAPC|nr:hypothetical protein [Flammeovirga pacifica]OHX63975.1 hypothetical protein NH26_20405 [Flammeovirga pacifica]